MEPRHSSALCRLASTALLPHESSRRSCKPLLSPSSFSFPSFPLSSSPSSSCARPLCSLRASLEGRTACCMSAFHAVGLGLRMEPAPSLFIYILEGSSLKCLGFLLPMKRKIFLPPTARVRRASSLSSSVSKHLPSRPSILP